MLRDFYYSEDRRVESGLLLLEEASVMTVRTIMMSRYMVLMPSSGFDGEDLVGQSGPEVLLRGYSARIRGKGMSLVDREWSSFSPNCR